MAPSSIQATSPRGWLITKTIVNVERPPAPRAFRVEGSLRCRKAGQDNSRNRAGAIGRWVITGQGFSDDTGLRDRMTASTRPFSWGRVGQGFRGATSQVISFALLLVTLKELQLTMPTF